MEAEFLTDNSVVKYGFNISVDFIYLPLDSRPSNGLIHNCNPHTGACVFSVIHKVGNNGI